MLLANGSSVGTNNYNRFFLFDLGRVDVILWVTWLEKLGDVKVNWKSLTMKFKQQGQSLEIQGDPKLPCTKVSLQSLYKT